MVAQTSPVAEPVYEALTPASDRLGVSERTLRRLIADGSLPAYRIGSKTIRVRRSDVDALLRRIPTTDAG
jgi:excisionase family DNA binding protein